MGSSQSLPTLSPTTALWRIEKLPESQIKAHLSAQGLARTGVKRTLARRLHDHPHSQAAPSHGSGEDDTDGSEQNVDESESDRESRRRESSSSRGSGSRRRSWSPRHGRRRRRDGSPLTSRELHALKSLAQRRGWRRKHRRSNTRSQLAACKNSASLRFSRMTFIAFRWKAALLIKARATATCPLCLGWSLGGRR